MAYLLLWLANESTSSNSYKVLEYTVTAAMFVGSVLVLIGTKGRHPGWVGLMSVAMLIWIGG